MRTPSFDDEADHGLSDRVVRDAWTAWLRRPDAHTFHERRGYAPSGIRLHDTRQAMATLMLAAGIRVEVVSKRLGHARISVTYDMYTHPDDEQQREAADTFGRLRADHGGT
jgi:integrase